MMGIATLNPSYGVVPVVVQQHAEDAAILWNIRREQARAPHVKLHHLRRFDHRIAAHLDGLAVAGEYGWKLCERALETPGGGQMFAAAVRAIEDKSQSALDKLFAVAQAVPGSRSGLISAFGWVSAQHLQGTAKALLSAAAPFLRLVGIAACSMHQADPGELLRPALRDLDPDLRARALRAAGELGRRDLLDEIRPAVKDADDDVRFWGAWSAVLLGDRREALNALLAFARSGSPFNDRATALLLSATPLDWAQEFLRALAQAAEKEPSKKRALISACGLTGNSHYVPWLIGLMSDDPQARLAGEAFSLITGLDLAWLDLERKPPETFESGPSDDPDDPDIDMDPDDGLPWPDQEKIEGWWNANSMRFPAGIRHFMGASVSRENCIRVLREGFQRQRIAAAQYLCLLQPGTPLFNIAAPAWRQKRLLDKMG